MRYFFAYTDVRCFGQSVSCSHRLDAGRTDLVEKVAASCKLKKHIYRRDVGRLRAWLHYDSIEELENARVLEGGMNAHLFVYCLALSLSGPWCQSHHLTSGDAMILGIDGLKYPRSRTSSPNSPLLCL